MGKCFSTPSDTERAGQRGAEEQTQNIPLRPVTEPQAGFTPPSTKEPADTKTGNARLIDKSSKRASSQAGGSVFLPLNSITRAKTLSSIRGSIKGKEIMSRKPNLNALRAYATLPSPSSSLPANVLLFANRQCLVIFDAYPKAKYHFLVLPRYPFPGQTDIDSKTSILKLEHLDDLKSLLVKGMTSPREEVINAMMDTAREVEEMIRDEMVKSEGFEWKIDVGFHAIPSMKHLHLHVISSDRISPSLKTKKHYNSFRPDLGFFINIMEIQRWVIQDQNFIKEHAENMRSASSLLDSTLSCAKCDEPFHNMPKLKAHLEEEWNKEKKRALERIRRTGRQRSSDEDELF